MLAQSPTDATDLVELPDWLRDWLGSKSIGKTIDLTRNTVSEKWLEELLCNLDEETPITNFATVGQFSCDDPDIKVAITSVATLVVNHAIKQRDDFLKSAFEWNDKLIHLVKLARENRSEALKYVLTVPWQYFSPACDEEAERENWDLISKVDENDPITRFLWYHYCCPLAYLVYVILRFGQKRTDLKIVREEYYDDEIHAYVTDGVHRYDPLFQHAGITSSHKPMRVSEYTNVYEYLKTF